MNSNPSQKAERNKSPRKTELQEIQAKLVEDRQVEEKKKSPASSDLAKSDIWGIRFQ